MSREDRERWDRRHREAGSPSAQEVRSLESFSGYLPVRGRALDLASGRGRVALALARRGLEVVACDVSPVGLRLAAEAAARDGLALATEARDLAEQDLPEGPWDVVTCFHYLNRPLLRRIVATLAPGGVAIVEIATVRNLERHDRPSRRYLLEPGELPELVGGEVLEYVEGWDADRHLARLVTRG